MYIVHVRTLYTHTSVIDILVAHSIKQVHLRLMKIKRVFLRRHSERVEATVRALLNRIVCTYIYFVDITIMKTMRKYLYLV